MTYLEEPLRQFLEQLSSGSATPGGGAAAALAGSLAASLVSMVANLTLNKRGYENVETAMLEVLRTAVELRHQLAGLVERDVAAFNEVMAAYALPQGNPHRPGQIGQALQKACSVPLEVAKLCVETLELSQIVAEHGNKNAASDAGAATTLAAAGLEIALLNVTTNLQSLADERFCRDYRERCEELSAAGARLRRQIMQRVRRRLGE